MSVVAMAVIAPALAAQEAPPAAQQGPVRVLDYTFTNPRSEKLRVTLKAGVIYRAEVNSTSITLKLRPLRSGMQLPMVQQVMMGPSASGGRAFDISPSVDGDYEISTVGGDPAKPVTLTIFQMPPKAKKE